MTDYSAARRAMIETQIRPASVHDEALLVAMSQIPRERFLPEARRGLAYTDAHHPLAVSGSFLTAPTVFAQLVQLAAVQPNDRVLDVAVASGYSTAVLAKLAGHVDAVEFDEAMRGEASRVLAEQSVANYALRATIPSQASGKQYDVIVVNAMLLESPDELLALLADGGRLVAVLQSGAVGVAWLYTRQGAVVTKRSHFDAKLPSVLAAPARVDFVF